MDHDYYLPWIEHCLILSVCASVATIVAEHALEIALGHDAVGPIVILTGPKQAVALVVIRSPLCERPIFS